MESLCQQRLGRREIKEDQGKTNLECLDNSLLEAWAYGFEHLWDHFKQWSTLMFWWSNRLKLWDLSLLYEIMRICEKNETLSVLEIAPQLPHCPNFSPKKQFPVWVLRRHEMTCASELKPHIHNNEDLWKKIRHFPYWKLPHSYHIVPILARKSSFQYGYLEDMIWTVLRNLSLIYIIMKIHEKKFTTLSIGILWTGTLLVFLPCGCCLQNSNTESGEFFLMDLHYYVYEA